MRGAASRADTGVSGRDSSRDNTVAQSSVPFNHRARISTIRRAFQKLKIRRQTGISRFTCGFQRPGHLRDRDPLAKRDVSRRPSGTTACGKRPCRCRVKRRAHARCRCRCGLGRRYQPYDRLCDRLCDRPCDRLCFGGSFLRRIFGNLFLGCLFRGLFRRFLRRFLRRFFGWLFGCFLCCFLCWFLCCHDDLLQRGYGNYR